MSKMYGTVVITGKPNVGKSTLFNQIAKKEVAIISQKPQTTRNQINYVYATEDKEIAFVDTPGFHFSRNKLDNYLNSQIKNAYKYANIALLLIDLTREINDEDLEVIKMVKSFNIDNVILVFNKIDACEKQSIDEYKQKVQELIKVNDVIEISALKNINTDILIDTISKYLTNDPIILKETDSDNFIISEIIREQIIKNFYQEIPYATCVCIKKKNYDKATNVFEVYADIVTEKESQKPIIIGRGGRMIKRIGTDARHKLHEYYNCKIILNLFVVVKNDWRNNPSVLKDGGYI